MGKGTTLRYFKTVVLNANIFHTPVNSHYFSFDLNLVDKQDF